MRTLFLHRRWRDRFASSGRLRLRTFAERSVEHLKRWALVYVAIAAIALWFHAHYGFGLNASPSLPHRLFLIHKGEMPSRGDFVAFRWAGGGPYPAGVTFIKVLAGMPGDEVTRDAQGFHLNGVPVGVPKPVSRQRSAARTRSHRPDSGGPLLRASRTPGQPRLPVPADRLDPRIPDHRAGRCALLTARSQTARPAAGRCARSGGLRRDGRDGVRPRPGPRRHRPGLPDRRAEPAGGDPRETSRGRRGRHARPSATRVAGRVRRGVEDPTPVAGLSRTRQPRRFHHDPSIVVQEAIRDADGRVIVPPGTVVNPLDTVTLSQALLFIDARDREQVARARKLIDERQGKVKVILTGGSYLDLMRRWQRPVFYDQQGNLTTKLGIRQVPALVTQDGRRLRIDELL
jgi:type-F conjugative transfer system protein TraW